jgi:hypothetical protein
VHFVIAVVAVLNSRNSQNPQSKVQKSSVIGSRIRDISKRLCRVLFPSSISILPQCRGNKMTCRAVSLTQEQLRQPHSHNACHLHLHPSNVSDPSSWPSCQLLNLPGTCHLRNPAYLPPSILPSRQVPTTSRTFPSPPKISSSSLDERDKTLYITRLHKPSSPANGKLLRLGSGGDDVVSIRDFTTRQRGRGVAWHGMLR